MRKPYLEPTVLDYGSIAACTFIASGGPAPFTAQPTPGPFICYDTPADSHVSGHKNYLALECDKFGEFSHPADAGS